MKKQPEVAQAVTFLQKATGQVAAVRRALEQSVAQSMDAPGGMEWERAISEPEEEDAPEAPAPTPPPWLQERKRKQAKEFELNWFKRLRKRLRR